MEPLDTKCKSCGAQMRSYAPLALCCDYCGNRLLLPPPQPAPPPPSAASSLANSISEGVSKIAQTITDKIKETMK